MQRSGQLVLTSRLRPRTEGRENRRGGDKPAAPLVYAARTGGAQVLFRPDHVPQLQRQIGNAALTELLRRPTFRREADRVRQPHGPVTIQRTLPAGTTIANLDRADHELLAIGTAMDTYNTAAAGPRTSADFVSCFSVLRDVERRTYRWIDRNATGPKLLGEQRHVPQLQAMLDKAQSEHERLTEATKDMDDVLPVDTSTMSEEEKAAVKRLWRDLVANRGKIKRVGSDPFNRRALSELAHILDTPTGRKLLAFLNAPADRGEDPASTPALLTNIYLGEQSSQLPREVRDASTSLEEKEHSEAQPLNINDTDRTLASVVNVKKEKLGDKKPMSRDYPKVTRPQDVKKVREAAWSGGKGFRTDTEKFTFNTARTGAFVTSFPDLSLSAGRDDRQILSPSWVTLGHELGHAANFRSGASTIDEKAGFGGDSLTAKLTVGPERGEERWDNAEEMFNIENVENPLRSEAGLSERDSHRPPKFAIARVKAAKSAMTRPLEKLHSNIGDLARASAMYDDHSDFKAVYAVKRVPAKQLLDPTVLSEWQAKSASFVHLWTVGDSADPRPSPQLNRWFVMKGL